MHERYNKEILNLIRSMQNIDYIDPQDIPNIDLYMDQVTTFMDEHLESSKRFDDDKILTKTMINNYVKHKYIKAPVNKKYDKVTVVSLLIIALLKQVYSINDISKLISLDVGHNSAAESYDFFCSLMESAVQAVFSGKAFEPADSEMDPRGILWNACNSMASWLYVRNIYLQP